MLGRILLISSADEMKTVMSACLGAAHIPFDIADDLEQLTRSSKTAYDLVLVDARIEASDAYSFCSTLRRNSQFTNALINLVAWDKMHVDWGRAFTSRIDDICVIGGDSSNTLNQILRQLRKRKLRAQMTATRETLSYHGFQDGNTPEFTRSNLSAMKIAVHTDLSDHTAFHAIAKLAKMKVNPSADITSYDLHLFAYSHETEINVIKFLYEHGSDLAFMCLVSKHDETTRRQLHSLGALEILSRDKDPWQIAVLVRNILGERRERQEIEQRVSETLRDSRIDRATGLFSKDYIQNTLHNLAEFRPDAQLSMVLFDLDDFKAINDRHGHLVGDEILQQIATKMCAKLRKNELLARFGGDEFLLILRDTPLENAEQIARRIQGAIAQMSCQIGADHLALSISYGAAQGVARDQNILMRADQNLLAAKAMIKGPFRASA